MMRLAETVRLITIDHRAVEQLLDHALMKAKKKAKKEKVLTVRCPTCGANVGQKCELSTGLPRTDPHRDRRLLASDK
jgi:hypothetical protein